MHLVVNDEETNRITCTLPKNETGEVQFEEYLDLVLNKHALGKNSREAAVDNVLLAAPWEQIKCDFKISSCSGAVPLPKFDSPDTEDGSYKQQVQSLAQLEGCNLSCNTGAFWVGFILYGLPSVVHAMCCCCCAVLLCPGEHIIFCEWVGKFSALTMI